MSHGADSMRSILFALVANLMIALAKLGAAIFTGSTAMLAEAVHSFADTGNQVLLIIGMRRARSAPSEKYPLGFGRAVYFWSFIVAILLFSMGGLFSIYEGAHKLASHQGLRYPWLAMGILAFSIVMESVSLWGCMREVNKARAGRGLWCWLRETRQSELVVVLGEDVAALTGLTFALVAISISMATGNPAFDALGSIAIGALLVVVAVGLGHKVKGLLYGQSVDDDTRHAIGKFVEDLPEVDRVINIITIQLGPDVMVAAKVTMKEMRTNLELMDGINRCEAEIKQKFPEVKWIFFEPDYQ